MFTYDNTDDGLGWWSRFTHMVDGGTYGYPYDYRPPENDKEGMAARREELWHLHGNHPGGFDPVDAR